MPFLFDVKRYSINDGPGVRVTVFFKGCPLACKWCHNPESQSIKAQRFYNKSKCIGCRLCVEACVQKALELTHDGIVVDESRCIVCGKCAEVCPTNATELIGRDYSEEEIMKVVLRERNLMDSSGGGVTFSGGEPMMYHKDLKRLLIRCGEEGIHRAVDTSGFARSDVIYEIIPHTDLFLYDLKHMDSVSHRLWTGVGNQLILNNLKIIAESNAAYHVRIAMIEGVNSDDNHIKEVIDFLQSLKHPPQMVGLLPYHSIAASKYERMGKVYNETGMSVPSVERQQCILNMFINSGFNAVIGG